MPAKHFLLLDLVRGLAIIFIFFYHYLQSFFGSTFLITADGFQNNLSRLIVFKGGGILDFFKNIFSILFAYGFAAVNIFIVLSGFVLTWAILNQEQFKKIIWWDFYFKKIKRILIPFYISVGITILLLIFRNYFFPQLNWLPDYGGFDLLKFIIPIFPFFDVHWLQQLNGDYWYIPLILQLYLIFPLLIWLMKKIGVIKFLWSTLLLTLAYRFLASYGYELLLPWIKLPFLDTAPMGVISTAQNSYYGFTFFLPRLFEFCFGMGLAFWQFQKKDVLKKIIGTWQFGLFLLMTILGFGSDYYRWGWIFSDCIIGVGFFGLTLNIANWVSQFRLVEKILNFFSKTSYEIYLWHHNFLNLMFLPILAAVGWKNGFGFWVFLPIYILLIALIGQTGFKLSQKTFKVL